MPIVINWLYVRWGLRRWLCTNLNLAYLEHLIMDDSCIFGLEKTELAHLSFCEWKYYKTT